MSSYEGPATIRQNETEVLVQCGFTFRPPSDTRRGEWFGRFTEATGPLEPREAELVLPTGETGQIIVNQLNGLTRASGWFQGTGPPPT